MLIHGANQTGVHSEWFKNDKHLSKRCSVLIQERRVVGLLNGHTGRVNAVQWVYRKDNGEYRTTEDEAVTAGCPVYNDSLNHFNDANMFWLTGNVVFFYICNFTNPSCVAMLPLVRNKFLLEQSLLTN